MTITWRKMKSLNIILTYALSVGLTYMWECDKWGMADHLPDPGTPFPDCVGSSHRDSFLAENLEEYIGHEQLWMVIVMFCVSVEKTVEKTKRYVEKLSLGRFQWYSQNSLHPDLTIGLGDSYPKKKE